MLYKPFIKQRFIVKLQMMRMILCKWFIRIIGMAIIELLPLQLLKMAHKAFHCL